MQPLFQLLATTRGRLRRRTYWAAALALTIAFAAFYALLDRALSHSSTLILYPPFLWAAFALMTKRLHDRAKSAWWLLLAAVPVVGPIVLVYWMGCARGTRGENQFGADPRTLNADYLIVRIGS